MLEAGHPDYLLGKRTLKPAVDGRVSGILGGSWAVITGVSRVTILITPIRGLITLLITTHEPPSSYRQSQATLTCEATACQSCKQSPDQV